MHRFPLHRLLRIALAGAVLVAAASPAVAQSQRVFRDEMAWAIGILKIELAAGELHEFWTSNSSGGADPILYVYDPMLGVELARDEDSKGGVEAYVEVEPAQTREYWIVVLPAPGTPPGETTIVQRTCFPYFGAPDVDWVCFGGGLAVGTVPVVGQRINVPSSATGALEYHAISNSTGTPCPSLLGLACNGELLSHGSGDGTGCNGSIIGHPGICHAILRVHPYLGGPPAPADLIVNDPNASGDGDRLGAVLEAELGTCDPGNLGSPGYPSYCPGGADPFTPNAADSDRDGIDDGDEVLGVDDPWDPLYLPRWGADPLQKDVFVEVDYDDAFSNVPLEKFDVFAAQNLFNNSDNDVRNPNGDGDIALHLDIGVDPDPGDPASWFGRFGDWGGSDFVDSGAVPSTQYYLSSGFDQDISTARAAIFHHAHMVPSNASGPNGMGGQGELGGTRFYWKGAFLDAKMSAFVHELGHNLGLSHWGHDDWGRANCKPNYPSLMNYAFNGAGVGFSKGLVPGVLNPSQTRERPGIAAGQSLLYLASAAFQRAFSADGQGVDWTADGLFEAWNLLMRAPLTWAPGASCEALTQNVQALESQGTPVNVTTPRLLRVGGSLWALAIGPLGEIRYRIGAHSGADADGSCPGGSAIGTGGNDDGASCIDWGPWNVATPWIGEPAAPAKAFSVALWNGQPIIAYTTATGAVRILRWAFIALLYSRGGFYTWLDTPLDAVIAGTPELAEMRVDPDLFGGESRVLALFGVEPEKGAYRWWTAPTAGNSLVWTSRGYSIVESAPSIGRLPTTCGRLLGSTCTSKIYTDGETPIAPSVLPWPAAEAPAPRFVDPTDIRFRDLSDPFAPAGDADCGAIGVFPRADGAVRVMCYRPGPNRWVDRTASAFGANVPTATARFDLAWHIIRDGEGAPRYPDSAWGQLWMAGVTGTDLPEMWVSRAFAGTDITPPLTGANPVFALRGPMAAAWTQLPDGVGVALYEDLELSSLKALWWIRRRETVGNMTIQNFVLEFMPFADGAFSAALVDGNDFDVMEDGICGALRGTAWCGVD